MKNRREFVQAASASVVAGALGVCASADANDKTAADADSSNKRGAQRLSLEQLQAWEAWNYGMFIHFQLATFRQKPRQWPKGQAPAKNYAPDKLDVDQWVSVARDGGMKYAVLTAKGVDGFCLWPSKHTDYTVAKSSNRTDVIEHFVKACEKKGIKPGLYYCSIDERHKFGSQTRSETSKGYVPTFPSPHDEEFPPYTTSLYQNFMTAQITELIEDYGPIAEMWIDIPGELGWRYRKFLYQHIAKLNAATVIMMNSGTPSSENYNVAYAWPSDLIAIERGPQGEAGAHPIQHKKWRKIDGEEYYLPAEICDPIGRHWYFRADDPPRSDEDLQKQYESAQQIGVNLLLNVPPDKHGVLTDTNVQAVMRLRKNVGI